MMAEHALQMPRCCVVVMIKPCLFRTVCVVWIGSEPCENLNYLTFSTTLSCELPANVGSLGLSIMAGQLSVVTPPLIQYSEPTITTLQGCDDTQETVCDFSVDAYSSVFSAVRGARARSSIESLFSAS
jgi:hypothetical protein